VGLNAEEMPGAAGRKPRAHASLKIPVRTRRQTGKRAKDLRKMARASIPDGGRYVDDAIPRIVQRERAAQVGAACELASAEDEGTVWRFQLAAAIAYLPEPRQTVVTTEEPLGSESA
jgi:hypothetical protein